jgi:CRP-like cAMP-binding protein
VILQRATKAGLVAEASVFSARYHCDAFAVGRTTLARIPKEAVNALQTTNPRWMQEFAAHLASEVQRARGRAELLALKKVGQRVDAWLTLNEGGIPPRGRRADWAYELGVTPEALYRELATRGA